MARQAVLLYEEVVATEQARLARMPEFFGVPWKVAAVSNFPGADADSYDQVVFGSAAAIATSLRQTGGAEHCRRYHNVFYAYSNKDRQATERGIRFLLGNSHVTLCNAENGVVPVQVAAHRHDVTGPMTGINLRVCMKKEDAFVVGLEGTGTEDAVIISAAGAPIYLNIEYRKIPIYFCASSYVIDIDDQIMSGYYNVRDHFCSVVPLVTFIRHIFQNAAWHALELGACLIIDDPLLKKRYGCCDFKRLRQLMGEFGFTTNIAFIPWNWRRTSSKAKIVFGDGFGPFSISIHGCDHVRAEFGDSSANLIYSRARLAKARMLGHKDRTGIHHDPIMVFPQGVFSTACPGILKRTGFLAAVNTEVSPLGDKENRARICDAWDVAIMRFGDFGIFTRRYAHHGIENFTFDLLLGKPCLIVAHHEFFRDELTLTRFLGELQALNCTLQ